MKRMYPLVISIGLVALVGLPDEHDIKLLSTLFQL